MRTVWTRFALVAAAGLIMSFLANEGLLDPIVATTPGLIAYWILQVIIFITVIFGIARPLFIHLNQSDSALARFLTIGMKKKR